MLKVQGFFFMVMFGILYEDPKNSYVHFDFIYLSLKEKLLF